MSIRAKIILINSLVAVLVALILIGSAVGSLYVVDNNSIHPISMDTLSGYATDLEACLSDGKLVEGRLQSVRNKLEAKGVRFAWYTQGSWQSYDGLSKYDTKVLEKQDLGTPGESLLTHRGIKYVLIVTGSTAVVAIDETHSVTAVMEKAVLIYSTVGFVVAVLLLVLAAALEGRLIFPRIKQLSHAMRQVYNGNYAGGDTHKRHRRDEMGKLLLEFDALRRKLDDATKQKEAFDRERGVLISGISHDLRTPLTVIRTHAKGVLDGVAQRKGKTDEYVRRIYDTASDMEQLIAKLSNFARAETREVMYSFVDRDLAELVREFVDNNYIPYMARGLQLKARLPQGKKLWVSLDKDHFKRVLQNIADNSLKYKGKPNGRLTITADIEGEDVRLVLSDDGPGIATFETGYIFESYYRGDPSRTNPISGNGLGLSIVKSVVEAHHGQVRAYNDNGLSIEILLPYRRKK